MHPITGFWSIDKTDLLQKLRASTNGLTEADAARRLQEQQSNIVIKKPWHRDAILLLSQYKNPLVLLLVFAVILSLVLGEYSDSFIVLTILLFTGILGFIQERNAGRAVEKLRALVHSKASVRREGKEKEIPVEEVVPGDMVILHAGDIIPADALIIEANDLHVNQSVLTGESFPAEKFATTCTAQLTLADITNSVFKGTHVINGTAIVLAANTGDNTELGKIAASLEKTAPETAFEKGIRQFGYLLMKITVIMTGIILIMNLLFHKPLVDSILFALALAVGLAPELLPAIVTITLSAGAKRMAAKKVIVKKLSAIQNLGEIDVLCSDKTGTLTEGAVKLQVAVDISGQPSKKVLLYAYLNAFFETSFPNAIDEALRDVSGMDIKPYNKLDEVPYDFIRKRLSIVVNNGSQHIMITKGAMKNIADICTNAEQPDGSIVRIETVQKNIAGLFENFCSQGSRAIAVCYKDVSDDPVINKDDENGMIFLGFIVLSDPPKEGIIDSILELRKAGVSLKLISGDNHLVVKHLAAQIGLSTDRALTGHDLLLMTDEVLRHKVNETDAFAEIEPAQKERIIKALQHAGHAVGYLGDGINDANAIKAADVGISIDNAVDVAKEAADLVLMERDIDVIREGVLEGRKTFVNTMKYIHVVSSANFGNMFSMAIASLALPFLPLLPTQILLNNFLSDLPSLTIASDKVDEELITQPLRWDIKYIKRFMIIFGLQSSLFDFTTFALLLFVFHAAPEEFRTGWFMESLLTQISILLIIRTRRSFLRSRPSAYLLAACSFTLFSALILPYLPFAKSFGLYPLPWRLLAGILLIAVVYILMSEITKKYLMKKM